MAQSFTPIEERSSQSAKLEYYGRVEEVVSVLSEDGPMSPKELSEQIAISNSVLTGGMLKQLAEWDLVEKTEEGTVNSKSQWDIDDVDNMDTIREKLEF